MHSLFKISDILDELIKSNKLGDNEKKAIIDYLVKNIEK
jgi:orotate phosphoribosyltransferase